MKRLTLPVESVQERDIDFLLVEEFLSSEGFRQFFTKTLTLPGCDKLLSVERSINSFGLGETDILVSYQHEGSRIGLLLENKLDAIFQPQQAERYFARAAQYEQDGLYDSTYVALVAPEQYIKCQSDFELCLSYEQLIGYFEQSNLSDRGKFKSDILRIASEKLRRGYVAVNSEPNQAFWLNYRDQLAIDVPAVSMKPVDVVPAGSDWIDLYYGQHKFIHKLSKGYLDFIAPDDQFAAQLESRFAENSERLTFKSGEVLRIKTTPLDRMRPFEDQLSEFNEYISTLRAVVSLQS